jgi:hypothetical protein
MEIQCGGQGNIAGVREPEERREQFAAAVLAGVSLPLDYVRLNISVVRGPS